jgi:hypothetical protein
VRNAIEVLAARGGVKQPGRVTRQILALSLQPFELVAAKRAR